MIDINKHFQIESDVFTGKLYKISVRHQEVVLIQVRLSTENELYFETYKVTKKLK